MKHHIIKTLFATILVAIFASGFTPSKANATNNNQTSLTNCNKPKKYLNSSYSPDHRLYFEVYYQCEVTTVYIENMSESNVYQYTFDITVNNEHESIIIPTGEYWKKHFNTGRKTSFKINYSTKACFNASTNPTSITTCE